MTGLPGQESSSLPEGLRLILGRISPPVPSYCICSTVSDGVADLIATNFSDLKVVVSDAARHWAWNAALARSGAANSFKDELRRELERLANLTNLVKIL